MKINEVAEKQVKKLDKPVQRRLIDYLEQRIENCKDPRHFGEPLKGNKVGYWRYRVGDYRIVCEILDEELIVLALAFAHRKEAYR